VAERTIAQSKDIFAVQDEITTQHHRAIAPGILAAEIQRSQARRRLNSTMGALDARALAHPALYARGFQRGDRLLDELLSASPTMHWLCRSRLFTALRRSVRMDRRAVRQGCGASETARRAVASDDQDAQLTLRSAFMSCSLVQHDNAIRRLTPRNRPDPNSTFFARIPGHRLRIWRRMRSCHLRNVQEADTALAHAIF
jgi:hypothetical protein